MKKIKFLGAFIVVIFFMSGASLTAQTRQVELHATVADYVFCLNKVLFGEWTYHFTYHVNKKTGAIESVHANVKNARLFDSEGNKYVMIDTGNDKLGIYWDYFNNINAMNEDYEIYYDIEDGFMGELPGEGEWPEKGMFAPGVIKFIGNGEKVTFRSYLRGYRDESGELIFEVEKYSIDCN